MAGQGLGSAVALFAVLASGAVAAQGVCVDCAEPNRNYRCTVKDGERAQSVRGGGRALEFLCISEIARTGGHQSCRVNTSYSGPCIGQSYEIDLAKGLPEAIVVGKPAEAEGKGAQPAPAVPTVPAKKGPPQTLEELAKDTVAKSKEQISAADQSVRKAGDKVGGAMQKTWECLTSLFSRC